MPYVRLKHHVTALSKALTEKQVPNVCSDVDEKNGSPFFAASFVASQQNAVIL